MRLRETRTQKQQRKRLGVGGFGALGLEGFEFCRHCVDLANHSVDRLSREVLAGPIVASGGGLQRLHGDAEFLGEFGLGLVHKLGCGHEAMGNKDVADFSRGG
jgi:uncharacterized protein YggL (DUF469 family)